MFDFWLKRPLTKINPEEERKRYIKLRRVSFIAFIGCLAMTMIKGISIFDETSVWFWLLAMIATFCITVFADRKFWKYADECVDLSTKELQERLRQAEKDKEDYRVAAEKAKKEITSISKDAAALKAQFETERHQANDKAEIANKNALLIQRNQELEDKIKNLDEQVAEYKIQEYINGSSRQENDKLHNALGICVDRAIQYREELSYIKGQLELEDEGIAISDTVLFTDIDLALLCAKDETIIETTPSNISYRTLETFGLKPHYELTADVLKGNFTTFDLETTGLSPEKDLIIELSAVKFRDYNAESYFSTLINPDMPISSKITEITGIHNWELNSAPILEKVWNSFLDFIGEDALVGHNIYSFDLKFLYHNGFNLSQYGRSYYDTLAISRKLFPKGTVPKHNLSTMLDKFNICRSTEHRGCSDAAAAGLLFLHLLQEADKQDCLYQI